MARDLLGNLPRREGHATVNRTERSYSSELENGPERSVSKSEPISKTAFLASSATDRAQPDLLSGLDGSERAYVLERGRAKLYRSGAAIFRQGDPHDGIFLIEGGLVRVFYTAPAGREITLAYWTKGNFCGGPEVFGSGTHVWSGAAASDTNVLCFAGQTLRGLAERFPRLALGIIDGLAYKGACYSHLAQMLGTRPVTGRLAGVLEELARLYGRRTSRGIEIEMPFTHDDLANMVGATRQWVSMMLAKLAGDGVISKSHRRLVILLPDRLAMLSDAALESAVMHHA